MRRVASLIAVATLVVTGCGGATKTAPDTTGAGSTYAVVPESEVTAGLAKIKALAAISPPDVDAIYGAWFTFEGTARARDKDLYLDLEDALANVKSAKDSAAAKALEAAIDAYLAAHPGDGTEAPITTVALKVKHTVAVRLDDYEFSLPSPLKAGVTKFEVSNRTKHNVTHEVVIFRTDLGARALPVDAKGKVDEKGAGVTLITEIENVKPDASGELVADLAAGSYVFACNVDDHYKRGMTIAVRVA